MEPMEALNALEAAQRFEILITRVRFAPGKPNGVSLAQMAQAKQSAIKVLFTVTLLHGSVVRRRGAGGIGERLRS